MNLFYTSVGMAIVANIAYHLCMKFTPEAIHPLASLAVTYAAALAACVLLLAVFGEGSLTGYFSRIHWSSYVLGFSLCALEVGFLLAYRAGWNISLAALFVNVAVGLILLPIGLNFFKEQLSFANWVGMVLAFAGLVLLGLR